MIEGLVSEQRVTKIAATENDRVGPVDVAVGFQDEEMFLPEHSPERGDILLRVFWRVLACALHRVGCFDKCVVISGENAREGDGRQQEVVFGRSDVRPVESVFQEGQECSLTHQFS
jgi:hypothetical protein